MAKSPDRPGSHGLGPGDRPGSFSEAVLGGRGVPEQTERPGDGTKYNIARVHMCSMQTGNHLLICTNLTAPLE